MSAPEGPHPRGEVPDALAGLARGDRSVLPEDGYLDVPVHVVRKENVREFSDALEARLAGTDPAASGDGPRPK